MPPPPQPPGTPTPSRARIGLAYVQVLLAGILWGTSGPFSLALYRLGVPPESVALLRPATGAAFLFIFVLVMRARSKGWRDRLSPGERQPAGGAGGWGWGTPGLLPGMLLLGGLIVGTFQFAYQMSTESVGVPATVALLYLAPALVVAASLPLFGERISLAKSALVALSVGGVWLTVFGTRGVDIEITTSGILWGCLCGLSYAAYTLFGKWYGRMEGPLLPLFWSTLGGTILLALAHAWRGEALVLPTNLLGWSVLLAFGLLTMALAALFLFNGMRTLEAGRASIGTTVEPLVATLLAWSLFGQTLTPTGILGLVLLVTGVAGAYALRGPRHRRDTPDGAQPH